MEWTFSISKAPPPILCELLIVLVLWPETGQPENGISFDGTVLWRYRLHSKQSGA